MAMWTLLDHPADLAVEGRGDTPEAALAAVVEGLLAQLGPRDPHPGPPEDIAIEGFDQEESLVSALNELLYQINVQQRWLACPEVLELGETRVRLRVRSRRRPADQALQTEIKAATYHDLQLTATPGGSWRLQVLFDV